MNNISKIISKYYFLVPMTTILQLLAHLCVASTIHFRYNISEEQPVDTYVGNLLEDYTSWARSRASTGSELPSGHLQFNFRTTGAFASYKLFRLSSASGIITTSQVLDRESICKNSPLTCQLTVDAIVTPLQHFAVMKITVTINDLNDNSPRFPFQEYSIEISAATPVGSKFALAAAEDADSAVFGVQRYSLLSDDRDDPIFRKLELLSTSLVDGSQILRLHLKQKIDEEEITVRTSSDILNATIISFDGGVPPRSGSMRLRIGLKRAPSPTIRFEASAYEATVAENATVGSWVARVKAVDRENDGVVYSLEEGQMVPFQVDRNTGNVYVDGVVDYERHRSFALRVVAAVKKNRINSAVVLLQINVTDINDCVPAITVNALRPGGRPSIAENQPRHSFVAHLVVEDHDGPDHSRPHCVLLDSDPPFRLLSLASAPDRHEYTLVSDVVFDRELAGRHSVVVACSDKGSPSLTSSSTIDINVLDENDNVPQFKNSSYTIHVTENSRQKEAVLQIRASDKDEGNNALLTYSISPTEPKTASSFEVILDELDGRVFLRGNIDAEIFAGTPLVYTIYAIDSGEIPLSGTTTLTINVIDVNDNFPAFLSDEFRFGVPSKIEFGTYVGGVVATDADVSDLHNYVAYSIDESASSKHFDIDATSGVITTSSIAPDDAVEDFRITVRASNVRSPQVLSTTCETWVSFSTRPRLRFIYPASDSEVVYVSPSAAEGTSIAQIIVQRSQLLRLSYSLENEKDDDFISIDASTGTLFIRNQLHNNNNHNNNRTYNLSVQARDLDDVYQPIRTRLTVVVSDSAKALPLIAWRGFTANVLFVVGVVVVSGIIVLLSVVIVAIVAKKRQRKNVEKAKSCLVKQRLEDVWRSGSSEPIVRKKKGVKFSLVDMDEQQEPNKMENFYTGTFYKSYNEPASEETWANGQKAKIKGASSMEGEDGGSLTDSGKGASDEGGDAHAALAAAAAALAASSTATSIYLSNTG